MLGALLGSAGAALAIPESDPDSQLAYARDLIGVDPDRAQQLLGHLRDQAIRTGHLESRLAADEIECRLLGDSDTDAALRIADAGLAAAAARPDMLAPAQPALQRLRACRAGVLIENGDVARGEAELEDILARTTDANAGAGRALALLERGVHRSRSGNLVLGQADLLAACASLAELGLARDVELCLGHLANHDKRMGDSEEALRLLTQLLDGARRRQARVDENIYLFSIAQVHDAQENWTDALRFYQEAEGLSETLGDRAGILYAEHGVGRVLLRMGRPSEALPHLRHALVLLETIRDPKQAVRTRLQLAFALTAIGEAGQAAGDLAAIEQTVIGFEDDGLRTEWLRADAEAQAQLGNFQRAYRSLAAWRTIDERLQTQQLSEHAGRLRMQFNREKDAADVRAMQQLNQQGERLHEVEGVALALFFVLLTAALIFATSKVLQARRLHLLASTDELTGLPNRRAVLAYVDEALGKTRHSGAELAVLMIDVDHFKRINDNHGHAVGDQVLRHLARALAAGLRSRDRVGRLGGEEFLAVLPDTAAAHAAAIAERMREQVCSTPMITTAGALRFSVSIGVATVGAGADAGGTSAGSLIENADAALYAAKVGGRNAVVTATPQPVPVAA
jgi:diguanylate cyclase (GGDEF)-like protein